MFWSNHGFFASSAHPKGTVHLCQYNASYGSIPIEAWYPLLYTNFAKCKLCSQSAKNAWALNYKRTSRVYIIYSICPFVCGWSAMLNLSMFLIASCTFYKNLEVNLGFESNIIELGILCSQMWSTYFCTNCLVLSIDLLGGWNAPFLSIDLLSPTLHFVLLPFLGV